MGNPGFGANTTFCWVGNVGSFPGVGVGSEADLVSRLGVNGAVSCVTRAQFCWKSRYEGRGELHKGRLFLEQVLCYLFTLLLWAVGCYILLLFPVTLPPVVTSRKVNWNWNFKGIICFSDTEIYHKPRPHCPRHVRNCDEKTGQIQLAPIYK
jgi:hypothetical protein